MDCSSTQEYEKHPTLWFDDGDIVVTAPLSSSPPKLQVFKVDRVFLARHSLVFKDMLSLGRASTQHELYDGVPLVRMMDDAKDLGQLLGAMYNIATLPLEQDNAAMLLYRIMDIAVKYEVEAVKLAIKKRVEAEWPSSASEWYQSLPSSSTDDGQIPSLTRPPPKAFKHLEPVAAIKFARAFDCPNILPAAWYSLSITRVHAEWNHYRSGCETHSVGKTESERTANWPALEFADLLVLMQGKNEMGALTHAVLTNCEKGIAAFNECNNPHCSRNFKARTGSLLFARTISTDDPLGAIHGIYIDLDAHRRDWSMCERCIRKSCELLELNSVQLWTDLPRIFMIDTPRVCANHPYF